MELHACEIKRPDGKTLLKTPAMTLNPGEIIAVTGPSGGGKSLWLKTLFGWSTKGVRPCLKPVDGAFLMVQDPSQGLTPLLSVWGHFKEVCPPGVNRGEVVELLERFGLSGELMLQRSIDGLSGGERQRLMLALILIQKPKVLVCDEPAASLDAEHEAMLWQMLNDLRLETGLSLIFVTHAMHLIERFADRVLLLQAGEIIFEGTKASFFEDGEASLHRSLIENYRKWQQTKRQAQDSAINSGAALLDVSGLSLERGGTRIFENFDWQVAAGEWWWVVGPSGCGKTSLAQAIAGLCPAQRGQIAFAGAAMVQALSDRSYSLRRQIQYIYQHGSTAFNPMRSVGRQLRDAWQGSVSQKYLDILRLGEVELDRLPSSFSLGEIQRLNVLRALGRKPRLLIGDEVLTSLDMDTKPLLVAVLDHYRQETGAAVVLITHDINPCYLMAGKFLVLG